MENVTDHLEEVTIVKSQNDVDDTKSVEGKVNDKTGKVSSARNTDGEPEIVSLATPPPVKDIEIDQKIIGDEEAEDLDSEETFQSNVHTDENEKRNVDEHKIVQLNLPISRNELNAGIKLTITEDKDRSKTPICGLNALP